MIVIGSASVLELRAQPRDGLCGEVWGGVAKIVLRKLQTKVCAEVSPKAVNVFWQCRVGEVLGKKDIE